jgi:hypothetical protein
LKNETSKEKDKKWVIKKWELNLKKKRNEIKCWELKLKEKTKKKIKKKEATIKRMIIIFNIKKTKSNWKGWNWKKNF